MQHYHNLHHLLTYSRAIHVHRLDFARCRTIALLYRSHEIQGLLVRVKSTIRERVDAIFYISISDPLNFTICSSLQLPQFSQLQVTLFVIKKEHT